MPRTFPRDSRLRRAEIGTHHHISGQHLYSYANESYGNEMAWREDKPPGKPTATNS